MPAVVKVTEGEMFVQASPAEFRVGEPYTFVATNASPLVHELVV
jgi:uncharacterized cupredoxin-like copper-binding protein